MATTSLNSSGKKIGVKAAKRKPSAPKPKYKCLICHQELDETGFYKTKGSMIWTEYDGRCLFCKDCLAGKFRILRERHGERLATMMLCHFIDAPFIGDVYESRINTGAEFDFGLYMRQLNAKQNTKKSFITSIIEGEMGNEELGARYDDDREARWSREDKRNKKECVDLLGYDPFDGFADADRKILYGDLLNYLDEDLLEDPFKLNMVIQIVISNNQIRALDLQMAKLNPAKDGAEIKSLTAVKKDLVSNINSISKENEISVRNRSTKQVGKGTLTALMKDLRDKDFGEAEVNFYDMLRSPGTLWAIEQSNNALMEHCLFDENDRQEIFMMQRELIQKLQAELDDTKEELRLVKVENKELRDG